MTPLKARKAKTILKMFIRYTWMFVIFEMMP
jgi:hypothetical protein